MGQTNDSTNDSTINARFDAPSPEAIARAAAAATAIPDAELVPIRVDVMTAAAGVIGQIAAIEAHRAAIALAFGDEGTQAIDGLIPAAHHLVMANGRFNASGDQDLEPLAASLREKRSYLQLVAGALDKRGVSVEVLRKLEGGGSYAALSDDTQALYYWFSAHLAEIAPHCKLTQSELDAIQSENLAFVGSVGIKARAGSGTAATTRSRAFTHFARTYDRVRKFVTYVRWNEGDFDQIAPSIYAGRARRSAEAPVAAPPGNDIAPGMPGASPFAPNPARNP